MFVFRKLVYRPDHRRKFLILAKSNFRTRFYDKFLFWLPSQAIIRVKFLAAQNKYSRIIQSQIFLIRANKALEDEKNRRTLSNLKVALELLREDISSIYRRHLISCYQSVLTQRSQHEVVSSEIVESTKTEINSGNESHLDAYYYLSKFLNWAGFLDAGFLAREKSVSLCQMIALEYKSSERQVEMSLAASLELGDLGRADSILQTFHHQIRPARLTHFRFHLNLLRKEETQFVNSGVKEFSASEIRLSALIKGKSVALVGTGNPLGDYGGEIDSFDLVVRVKYPGQKYLPPAKQHGRRCDIAYYTTLEPFRLISEIDSNSNIVNGLKFILSAQVTELERFQDIPILYLSNLRSVFPNGDLTSGVLTLANLLRFQPSSLKLFGFDFYANPRPYNSEMVNFYNEKGWLIGDPTLLNGGVDPDSFTQRIQGHFWHDQIANFSFVKNLFGVGAIKSEPVSADILALTPKQYASRLEILLRNLFIKI